MISAKADGGIASVATLRPLPEFAASAADVTMMAQQIDAAANIVIMCGGGCHGAAETAVHHKLPVKVIVYNNSGLGLIVLEAEGVTLLRARVATQQ